MLLAALLIAAGLSACVTSPNGGGDGSTLEVSYLAAEGRPEALAAHLEHRVAVPRPGIVALRSLVEKVHLPAADSVPNSGERATVLLRLGRGQFVPGHPWVTHIRLHYDSYANPFVPGQAYVLQFLADGRFYGIEDVFF